MVCHDWTEVMNFGEEYNRQELSFSLYHITEYIISICLIGDVGLDHLVNVETM